MYLDYAANTPVDEEVLEEFVSATRKYIANPNSSHPLGEEAKNKIDEVSEKLASYFECTKEGIIYTSGSSESNNLVLKGLAESYPEKKKIIISSVEHSSIVSPCNYLSSKGYDISLIDLNDKGQIDLEELEKEIDDNTLLVSVCSVDSELGSIMPIEEISKICKKHNVLFHTDATQAIGKTNIDYSNVDFITFAPHKFFGLNGQGALINRNNIKLTPLIHGGKSTTIYRSGTPVTANILSLYKSFKKAVKLLPEREAYITELNNYLREELSKIECVHINSPIDSIPNTLNFSLKNVDRDAVINKLYEKSICLSTTSACSMKGVPSKSVYAITKDKDLSTSSIRISLSYMTTKEELEEFINIFKLIINGL